MPCIAQRNAHSSENQQNNQRLEMLHRSLGVVLLRKLHKTTLDHKECDWGELSKTKHIVSFYVRRQERGNIEHVLHRDNNKNRFLLDRAGQTVRLHRPVGYRTITPSRGFFCCASGSGSMFLWEKRNSMSNDFRKIRIQYHL